MSKGIIQKMCDEHNAKHPDKGILTVQTNIVGVYSVGLGMVPILSDLTEDEAFKVVAAIKNYADAQED